MISFTPLIRPPPPLTAAHPQEARHPRVLLRHPGYRDLPNNILLSLPAVDLGGDASTPPSQRSPGLHHRTALTAGAVIANNAFDRAYLTYDQAAQRPVRDEVALDGLLGPGDYWLQLRGEEPPSAWFDTGTCPPLQDEEGAPSATRDHALPPVPDHHAVKPPPPWRVARPPPAAEYEPYPIVPTFRDWPFPHHRLPAEWSLLDGPSRNDASSSSDPPTSPPPRSRRCYLTDLRMGVKRCNLIPSSRIEWFRINGMAEYAASVTGDIDDDESVAGDIDDDANIIRLRTYALAQAT